MQHASNHHDHLASSSRADSPCSEVCTTKLSPNLQISLNMQLRVAEYDESYVSLFTSIMFRTLISGNSINHADATTTIPVNRIIVIVKALCFSYLKK